MRLAALTPVAGPYVIARYTQFTHDFPSHDLSLIELGETSATYAWEVSQQDIPYQRWVLSQKPSEHQSRILLIWRIFQALNKIQPDAVILCGYGVKGMLAGLLWSRLNSKPVVLLSETKEDDANRKPWREVLKRGVLSQYHAALVGGQPHKRYFQQLGMHPAAIFTGYDVVGNDAFDPSKTRVLPRPLASSYFLAINRFVPKKNLFFLLGAYAAYRHSSNSEAWDLVLCGDGPLRFQLKQHCAHLGIEDSVHFPGFLQQNQLLPYFAHAGCFIHASRQEQWGLVVNEAMAAGLPVLVSNRCGCFEDLVEEGVNGFGFDPGNQAQLTELMLAISSEIIDHRAIGQAALSHIQKFSPQQFAQGLKQALEYALAISRS